MNLVRIAQTVSLFGLLSFLSSVGKGNMAKRLVLNFTEVSLSDVGFVGGKNASLGEMIQHLSQAGVEVPYGFAITAHAYWYMLKENNLKDKIAALFNEVGDTITDTKVLRKTGQQVRALFDDIVIPQDLKDKITKYYKKLSQQYGVVSCDVAVRSSATAEDLPDASFAGQQDTFLNVYGVDQLLHTYKKCITSLFTDRAIIYRHEKGFDQLDVAIAVGVQKMIRSDKASSGVAFSLDTESGFDDVVLVTSSYGLGESIVQGLVTPDEFMVHKTTMQQGFKPLIKKTLGSKDVALVYAEGNGHDDHIKEIFLSDKQKNSFSLTDDEVFALARMVMSIEDNYSQKYGKKTAIDVEWAKDGDDNKLYIVQARPETVHSSKDHNGMILKTYQLITTETQVALTSGLSIGQAIAHGIVKVITDASEIDRVKKGDVIVTRMTDPDWVPAMKKAAAIITEKGGRTCHAAIVSRELGIPALVGTSNAMSVLQDGKKITLDCSQGMTGYVYDGHVPFDITEVELATLPDLPVKIMLNLADPSTAFKHSYLPVTGIGLVRLEFIITNAIKVHPSALVHPEVIDDQKIHEHIASITHGYKDGPTFFVETLAHHIGMMAAAFYPRPIIVRLTDFKTNEYYNLVGGSYFELPEENPMIGFRGASRYYHPSYKDAFALECAALKKVRDEMGLTNVKVMVPFVRTTQEAEKVIDILAQHGLQRGDNDLELVMMCEIPSNVILIDEFSKYFDGFSIGSNDLTQLTLGVDRDSEILAPLFDERDAAVKKMIQQAIIGAHRNNRFIGICGQAPSDHVYFAAFLLEQGIDSISLNADSVIPFFMRYQ